MRILIIEDNPDIAANAGDYLAFKGHSVDYASDGLMGLNLAKQHTFDAIVLDVNLPRMDGFKVCEVLKRDYQLNTPVLMLTARNSLQDKVVGFEAGALDYLVKPFELKELELRLLALESRAVPNQTRCLKFGDVVLYLDEWRAERTGEKLDLHQASLKVLEVLMRAAPSIVPRRELEHMLYGEHTPNSDPLRSHMYELRKELDRGHEFKMLKTARGLGFSLLAQNQEKDSQGELDDH